jgi:hypothetical protein
LFSSRLVSRPEALSVFSRRDKRLNHFGVYEVAPELIKLREPEIVAREVRVGRGIWIAPQIAKVLD